MKKIASKIGQATITDVARAAGVSRSTASRVLGGYGYTAEDTRQRVLDAARELSYQPNLLARSMVTGQSRMIGVVVADIENLYFAQAIRAITDSAREHGFGVVLSTTDEDIELERRAINVLLANRVEGLIVSPTSCIEIEHLLHAQEMCCPVVLLDRRVPALNADTFTVDNFTASYKAVFKMLENGHRRIALISNAPSTERREYLISPIRERIDGYRAALYDFNVSVREDLIVLGGWDKSNLAKKIHNLLLLEDRPTGFLATDSSVGLLILNELKTLKLKVPDQVSLICFDDAEWTTAMEPPLTVVSQPIKDLARAATEDLIKRIKGKTKSHARETLLTAELLERGSVGLATS